MDIQIHKYKMDQVYKILIVGNGGVGKTAFVTQHTTGRYEGKYAPTMGVVVKPVCFETNRGTIQFNLWDVAGNPLFSTNATPYYTQSDGMIAMFDTTNPYTLSELNEWINGVKNITGQLPISICGNKCDEQNEIDYGQNYDVISVKNKTNINKPFLDLARQLTGYVDLVFT